MTLAIQSDVLGLVAAVCVGAAALGCVYLLVASVAVLRFAKGSQPATATAVPLTILKPLHGGEPGLAERLASFCLQDYGAPVQMVCAVADRADPAAAAVRQLAQAYPELPIELNIDARQHGANRKVSNLANALAPARHDLLVLADSDIAAGPQHLARIMIELQRPGVGAVTCLYHGVPAAGEWSAQSALAINSHFLPNVIVGLSCGLARPCFGSTIAMRRSVLAAIGGLKEFADCLADDYAIGEAVRSAGYRVAISGFSVAHVCFQRSLRGLIAHELRAARTIKSIEPLGYCGTLIAHPFPLALIAALLGATGGLVLAPLALIARAILCLAVKRRFALGPQPYRSIPVRELISFAVFALSFFGATVDWRGASFRINRDGSLVPDQNRASA
jgi:ceramide glucosyltransferase